jgi:hypothetical protein
MNSATLVRDQPAPADDDQVRGGLRDLAHQVRGDEDRLPPVGQVLQQRADPADALDVQAVDRLVEDHGGGIAEQRRRDAQPLPHAEGEPARPPARHRAQAGRVDDLIDPGPADAGGLREREQMVVGAAGRVDRPRVQHPAQLAQRRGMSPGRPPVDRDRAAGRLVQAEDHPHGGGLPGAVRAEEAGDHARPDRERQVRDRGGASVAFGQCADLNHGHDAAGRAAPRQ